MNLFIFIMTIILITIIITLLILNNYNKNDYFSAKKIVYLSLYQTKMSGQTIEYQSKVKSAGGAGYILCENGIYNVIAFGYFDDEDAVKVKKSVEQLYQDAELFERIIPKIKRKVKSQIRLNHQLQNVLKILSEAENQIYKDAIELDKSNISVSEIYKHLVKLCYAVQESLNEINAINNDNLLILNIKDVFITSLQLFKDAAENCKSQLYKGDNVSVFIKYFFINLCEIDVDLRQELNKI